jgi:hypothetical protein
MPHIVSNREKSHVKVVQVLITVAVISVVAYRACILQITNDEAYSYMLADAFGTSRKLAQQLLGTANTHWLNTIWLMIASHTLGHNELWLRLPNVLSAGVFTWYLLRIFSRQGHQVVLLIPIALILLNGYLMDFFSLCRGYGIGMGLEMIALHFMLQRNDGSRSKVFLFLALATLANFSFLLFMVAFVIYDAILLIKDSGLSVLFVRQYLATVAPALLVALIALPMLLYIKYYTGDLEEGLPNGIVTDTLGVFLLRSYWMLNNLTAVRLVACGIVGLVALRMFSVRIVPVTVGIRKLIGSILVTICIIYLLFYALHVPFAFGRTALFIIVPTLVVVTESIIAVCIHLQRSFLMPVGLILFAGAGLYLAKYRQIDTTIEWWMQQGLKECFNVISVAEGKNIQSVKVGMSIEHLGALVNFYGHNEPSKNPSKLVTYDRGPYENLDSNTGIILSNQHYLLMMNDYHKFLDTYVPPDRQKVIAHFPAMKTDLVEILP